MMNTTGPLPTARTEELPAIEAGDIITSRGVEYYVSEAYRGSLELVRLHDLTDGFTLSVPRLMKAERKATEEERGRVSAMKLAKLEADAKFIPGALVRPIKARKHTNPNALYVILKASAKTVSITELGGNRAGAHLTAPRAGLAIVDPADVLK